MKQILLTLNFDVNQLKSLSSWNWTVTIS